ncbi:hypothetical protein GCK72_001386 [Caenorhabditis remanei]|uniref:CRE-MPS-3 protein n=1 Tax=Caenorhabditis remanei TaxID=31234 RepID=E3MFK9_CAERE|nr:hypothetical protein GCK72_001386 [Caenorhabditis remanei]EFP00947.1 CRE-MPS-3 protein [Caenorhabditis remanei]KAF1769569.1 hypothetical protein GCK72_001386 [Caenorhabditis remanei]
MPTEKASSSSSSPWIKVVIFVFVGILIVAGIVFAVIFCMKKNKKKAEEEKKKKGSSSSSSKSKSNKDKKKKKKTRVVSSSSKKSAKVAVPPPRGRSIIPQIPLRTKSTDETVTPTTSFTSSPTHEVAPPAPSAHRPPILPPLGLAPPVDDGQRASDEQNASRDNVTVLCTYGNGWKAKGKPPPDFSFSIESE